MKLRTPRLLLLAILMVVTPTAITAHGLHLSIGKAELDAKAFTGKLVFNRDDFVEALDQWNDAVQVHELTPEAFEKLTLRYMKRHFKVEANGKTDMKLEITKAGQGNETIWMHFRFVSSDSIKQIKVEHRVLFRAFPDQGNVLEVKAKGKKQSHLFKTDSPVVVFKL